MNLAREYVGSLYQGDQLTKGWNAIGKGHLTLRVVLCEKNNSWKLEAKKDEQKVWECLIQEPFSPKLRDNFVQWNLTNSSKERVTFGFRIKDLSLAQEFAGVLAYVASNPPSQDRQLNITLPSKQKIVLTFKKSMTMASVLKLITSQQGLEHSLYALAAAGSSSLKPQMTVNDLKSSDIIVVRRHKPSESEKPPKDLPLPATVKHEEEMMLLNVTLPNEKLFEMSVNPSITLLELQRLICIQNSLNPAAHKFDLMIANQDKIRLKQLKVSSISLVQKEGVNEGNEGTDGGSLKTKIRMAPPPPKSPSNRHIKPHSSSSPLSKPKGKESSDGTTEDINDFVSKMLHHQAIGTDSPSKDLTRRKLNPAPPPPQSGAKKSQRDKTNVKRVAPPPPPIGSHSPTTAREEVDSNEKEIKQHIPPIVGIPLPCMTTSKQSQQQKKGTPQETRKSSPLVTKNVHLGEDSSKNTRTFNQMTPPLPYSPGKKPTRKAPTKPPSKPSGSSSNQMQLPLPKQRSDDLKNSIASQKEESKIIVTISDVSTKQKSDDLKNSVARQEEESKIIVTTSDAKGQSQIMPEGAFVFKIPPPPPKKSPVLQRQEQVDAIPLKHKLSENESDEESEETNSTAGSSMFGGYNIESTKTFDQSSGTDTSDNSDSEENSKTESDFEDDSNADQNETDSNADQGNDASDEKEETDQNTAVTEHDKSFKTKSLLPAEPDSSSDENDNEGVILLSHQTTESSLLPGDDGSTLVSETGIQSSNAVDKIASLRNLIADTCEIGGGNKRLDSQSSIGSDAGFDLTTIKQMGPPPDNTPSSVVPDQLSPTPPVAPPPPPINKVASPTKEPPPPATKPKPPPPAVKPKPHPQNTSGKVEDELAMKLKRRQLLMNETAIPHHNTTSPVTSNGPPTTLQTSIYNPSGISGNISGVSPVSTTSVGGGPDMQLQLQMLQQQMLQQQMMQLQQQFQQLQSMMVTNPSPAAGLLLQQQMQQMQQLQSVGAVPLQQSSAAATAGTLQPHQMMMMQPQPMVHPTYSMGMGPQMLPQQSLNPSLLVANQPVMTPSIQPTAQQAFQQIPLQSGGFVPQGTLFAPSPPPPPNLLPPAPPPPPPPSIEIEKVEPPTGPAKSLSRKPSEADVRMKALGTATETFDSLMNEVRDTNPLEILKKPPEIDKDQVDHDSAYTGMTAALVQAMKERRKSFQDSNYEYKRESMGSTTDWEET